MTVSGHRSRSGAAAALLALLVLAGTTVAADGSPPAGAPPRRTLSVVAAVFRPSDGTLRDLYGGTHRAVTAQIDVPLTRRLAVFGGVRYFGATGSTAVVGAPGLEERYPLQLHVTAVRGGALVLVPAGAWTFQAGAGASYSRYTERWAAASLEVRDGKVGMVVQAAAARALTRRFSLVGRVEYSSVPHLPAARGDSTTRVDLGGLDASAGVGFRF